MKVSLKLVWLLAVVSLVCIGSSEFVAGAADFKYVTIYKAKPGRSAMYIQFTKLKDGTLMGVFRDSKIDEKGEYGEKGSPWSIPGSRIMYITSSDNGRTWTDTPILIFQDKDCSSYPSECGLGYVAKDGSILIPCTGANKLGMTENFTNPDAKQWHFIMRSRDNGRTWTQEMAKTTPFAWTMTFGGIVKLNDGTLTWNLHGGLKRDANAKGTPHAAILMSFDDGKTWSEYTLFKMADGEPAIMNETSHVELPNGKLVSMARPYMLQGISLDRGRTWKVGPSTLTRKGTSGLCPSMRYTKAGPPGGTIILAWHDRWGEHDKKHGVYISFSHDEGETWGYPTWIGSYAYPCLYELEKDSGKFLCGYYRSISELKGVFFSVPFPTGIRSTASMKDSGLPCITVEWDAYKGKGSGDYEYRVYRLMKSNASLEQSKLLFSGRNISSYHDETVETNHTYYYRVAACLNGRVTNKSWQSSAMVTVNAGF